MNLHLIWSYLPPTTIILYSNWFYNFYQQLANMVGTRYRIVFAQSHFLILRVMIFSPFFLFFCLFCIMVLELDDTFGWVQCALDKCIVCDKNEARRKKKREGFFSILQWKGIHIFSGHPRFDFWPGVRFRGSSGFWKSSIQPLRPREAAASEAQALPSMILDGVILICH